MKGHLIMKESELLKIEVLEKIKRKEIKQKTGAKILGISTRQMRRTLKRYKLEGGKGLAHKSRGRISNSRIPQEKLDKAIRLIRDKYWDFGPTLANEKLLENHQIKLSSERLRQEMISTGIWKNRKKKKAHVHQLRERRSCFGELVQLDGSPHDWFEGRAPKCNLNVAIDDASSISFYKFSKTETTQDYFKLAEEYFLKYGLPLAFYTDKHSVFRINKDTNLDLKKPTKNKYEGLTQFGRAMKELGIELIFANIAQAKGRVEKVNRTLQNRLVKEMRLEDISSIEEANKFLPGFMKKINKKFSVKPKSKINIHRKLDKVNCEARESTLGYKDIDLTKILCVRETRILSKNLTCQLKNTIFQIKTKRSAFTLRKTRVTICERYDGEIKIYDSRNNLLSYTTIKQLPSRKTTNSKQLNEKMDAILIKEAQKNYQKKNIWESELNDFTNDNYYSKPTGAV